MLSVCSIAGFSRVPGRHGRPTRMLGPWLVDARGMFGVQLPFRTSVASAGDLVRYVALGRERTSLSLPTPSRPRNPLRVVQAHRETWEIIGWVTSCAAVPQHWA